MYMNEILRKAVVATLVMVSCVTGVAQNSHVDVQKRRMAENGKIIFIDGRPDSASLSHYVDSVRHEIETFYYDQFRQFNDPGAPYFMFMSKDANMALGIGGVVRMRAWYDWDGAILVSGFAPYLIPMHPSPTDMRHFGTTPAGTCIYMRAIGRNRVFGRYNIYIEANFNGWQGRDFHLKKAYAQFRDWTVGYAPSTFSNPQALAPTVDAKGHLDKLAAVNV